MLQSMRDNLKGTVAVFVLAIFIIPLVLFGVEQLFVGSVGGTEVASVNGESINRIDFQRELALEKQRLQQQFELPANSPRLEDSALSGPVLQRMVQREALYQAAIAGGMGASKEELWKQIASIEAFQIDGKFNYDLFKERISYMYTPANFLLASERDFVLGHMNTGVSTSAFVTAEEIELLAAITQQKRTFSAVKIPKSEEPSTPITDAEIEQYYQNNSAQFLEPEQLKVTYVELSLESLADAVQVNEEDVRQIYQEEISSFKPDPRYSVAHILIEESDAAAEQIKTVEAKLAEGADFADLAKEYSDDLGSKDAGGNLGIMINEAYPQAFVEAAQELDVGAVSGAVKTEAGYHFIKLLDKTNVEPPSFEERESFIARQLAQEIAQETYMQKLATLDEKTFGADSLQYAADALGLEVKVSGWFTRQGGSGVMSNQQLVNEAFGDEVLVLGHNSRVIETNGNKAYVVRLNEHEPEHIQPLAEVRDVIEQQLTEERIAQESARQAQEVLQQIASGKSAEEVAKEQDLEYTLHEKATRSSFEVGSAILQKAFALARPANDEPILDLASLPDGSAVVIRLTNVEDGTLEDLAEAQRTGLTNQLRFQISQNELSSFESGIIEQARIKM